jgi:hypothetical protein
MQMIVIFPVIIICAVILDRIASAIIASRVERGRLEWVDSYEYKRNAFRERGEDYDEYLEELRLKRERDAKFKYLSGY